MSAASLNTLVNHVTGGNVVAFFLVLARITPLFIIAPVFSSTMLIPQVRAVLAVAVAVGLTPVAAHGQHLPTEPLAVLGLMLAGLLVGFAVSYAVATMFAAVQGAGVLADNLAGFSFGATVDPINGNQGGSLTNLYSMVGMALFLAIGGDAWLLRGLTATFRIVPLGSTPPVGNLVGDASSMFGSVLLGAVEIAAPVMLAIVITDVAFGMVARVVPQLNIFSVGFPLKVGVALIVVGISLPFVAGWMTNGLDGSVTSALRAL